MKQRFESSCSITSGARRRATARATFVQPRTDRLVETVEVLAQPTVVGELVETEEVAVGIVGGKTVGVEQTTIALGLGINSGSKAPRRHGRRGLESKGSELL